MKKAPIKKPPSFPIQLDYEEDSLIHVAWLRDQQASFDEFHKQVMEFLQPKQAELKTKWRQWWDRMYEKYGLEAGKGYQIKNVGSRWATIEESPPDPKTGS